MKRLVFLLIVTVMFAALVAMPAGAQDTILTHKNSSLTINPASQAGAFYWLVDGVDNLYQQWWWLRVGDTGGETSLDAISAPVITNPTPRMLIADYSNSLLDIEATWFLTGGQLGSGVSDLMESLSITNTSGSAVSIHLFEYTDMDLGGNPAGDEAMMVNTNVVKQWNTSVQGQEAVISASTTPSHWEINYYANTLNSLNDGLPTTLSDTTIGQVVGPGDMTWAFQWDIVISAGGTALISKDKMINPIVPEPSGLLLLVPGAAAVLLRRRRRA